VFHRWWIAGLVLHRHDYGWLIPFLVWLALTIRLITFYVSTKYITKAILFIWNRAIWAPVQLIPQKLRLPLGAAGTIAVFLLGTFVEGESADNTRANRAVSLFGLLVFIGAFYATSRDRKAINWQTVIVGMLAQYILALFVLRTKAGVSLPHQLPTICSHDYSMIFSTSSPTLQSNSLATLVMVPHSSRVLLLLPMDGSLSVSFHPSSSLWPLYNFSITGDGYNGSLRSLQPSSSTAWVSQVLKLLSQPHLLSLVKVNQLC